MTATHETIRVLVVEDHHVVRQGLVALLNVVEGIEVVGQAADGVEAIAQYRKCQPNVTLIDLRMPRLSGVEVIQRIRMETPQARFIVLTTYDGDEDIYRALQAGARSYLLKGMTTDELVSTIRAVHAGKSHIPPAIAQRLAERMGTEELTPRDRTDRARPQQQRDRNRVGHLRGHRKNAYQQSAWKARRNRSNAGRHGCYPARHRTAGIPAKAEAMRGSL